MVISMSNFQTGKVKIYFIKKNYLIVWGAFFLKALL